MRQQNEQMDKDCFSTSEEPVQTPEQEPGVDPGGGGGKTDQKSAS